jgi:flagellar biosynthesis/type III secretory pathway M-ring protein FliF/YscJ
MDFLNRTFQSISELLRSMTPAAQVSSVIMLLAIVVSMAYLFQYQINGGSAYLFSGQEFSQSEIGQMETALSQAGLNQYEVVGNRIRVPLSARDKYTKAIADGEAVPNSIVRRDAAELGAFEGRAVQLQKLKVQKTKKIEDMIRESHKIANVLVEYDEDLVGGPLREKRVTCAVMVTPVGSYQLSRDDLMGIQAIVRTSLAGIKDRDISIVDRNAVQTYSGETLSVASAESEYLRNKRWWEDEYRKKIKEQLISYQGVNVGVEVELDPTLGTNTYQRTLDTPTTLQQQAERQTTRSQTGGNGGPPGTRSNLPAAANAPASLGESRQSSSDTTKESSNAIAGGTIQHIQMAGLTPKRAKVSVGIPQRTVEKLFAAANPPPEGTPLTIDANQLQLYFEEMIRKPISEKVRTLIKPSGEVGQDPYEDIVVHMDPSLAVEEIPTTPLSESALNWLAANWQNLGLFGFGLISLVMLRSMVNGNQQGTSATERADSELNRILPTTAAADDDVEEVVVDKDGNTRIVKRGSVTETAEEQAARENQLRKRFQNRQPSLRDELTELVEADLDAAATVLKSWIGEPAV